MKARLRRWFRVNHIRDDESGFWRYIVGRGYELGLGPRSGFRVTARRCTHHIEWNVALFLFTLHWSTACANPPNPKRTNPYSESLYGFYFFDGDLWVGWGKLHCITMPWRLQHVQTLYLDTHGVWVKTPQVKHVIKVPFTYHTRLGQTQERVATLTFSEWYGRPRALRWTKLFEQRCAYISIEFNAEVGDEAGSWKGGVLGTTMAWDGKHDPVIEFMRYIETKKF